MNKINKKKDFEALIESVNSKIDENSFDKLCNIIDTKADKSEMGMLMNSISSKADKSDVNLFTSNFSSNKLDFEQKFYEENKKIEFLKTELEDFKYSINTNFNRKLDIKEAEKFYSFLEKKIVII